MLVLVFLSICIQFITAAPTYNCDVEADLIFVLDGSDSLSPGEFNASKQFVKEVIQQLNVEQRYVQIGVIVYSTFVGGSVQLGAFTSLNILNIFIDNLNQPRQGTATDLAITRTTAMFDDRRPERQNAKKIGVILTDGRSTSPPATINAAFGAKASGIKLFTIGYGSDVFVYELEQIATNPSTTMILTNSTTDPAFMAEFMSKLHPLICDLATTTPQPVVTTPVTLPPSTQKLVTDDFCPNCMKDVNFGYKPYPGDCRKYIDVRPGENGGSLQEVKTCPFGTYWDTTVLTCQYSWMVNCAYDPCTSYLSGTLAMPGLCSGYWTCSNYRANATCCPAPNQRYVQGIGCIQDFSCTAACPDDDSNKLIGVQKCTRYVYQLDKSKYYEENHGRNITRNCAPGTLFDQKTCLCSIMSDLNTSPINTCGPEVHFDFNSNSAISDISGHSVIVGNKNTFLNGQFASFSGNSNLNLWRFSNMNFGTKITIEFQFISSGVGSGLEALVSNCIGSDAEEASILIYVNKSNDTMHFRTITYQGTAEVSIPFNPSLLNTVTYVYDGKTMTGVVNVLAVQRALTGDIKPRQTGIILGAASNRPSFTGQIDEFKLYKCFPDSVRQYVSV